VLDKKNLSFSTIGNPDGYLIRQDGEIVKIIDSDNRKHEFSFISNGEINP
jgi:hypothetical protein